MANERDPGFGARNLLTAALVLILLIWGLDWGPLVSYPVWLAIRIGYLIAIPTVARLLLNWIWKSCSPTKEAEDRFERALYAVTAGVFAILAIQAIETPIKILGPHQPEVFIYLMFAGFAFERSVVGEESIPRLL